jgi:hypothetical protein
MGTLRCDATSGRTSLYEWKKELHVFPSDVTKYAINSYLVELISNLISRPEE